MKPVAIYKDPMVPGDNCLVLCETQDKDGCPHVTNNRNSCAKVGVIECTIYDVGLMSVLCCAV